jgi:myotubularin-related protein 1/2
MLLISYTVSLQSSIIDWCVSAEISEDADAAATLFEQLVAKGFLSPQDVPSPSKKHSRTKKHSSKRAQVSSEEGTPLESSNASSGSSGLTTSTNGLVYEWNMAVLKPAIESVTSEEPVEGEQPTASTKRSKKSKRRAIEVEESVVATLDGSAESPADDLDTIQPANGAEESKFGLAMLPPVRTHRAPSRVVDPMAIMRARSTIAVIPEEGDDEDSIEGVDDEHLDDTIEVLQKYLQSLAPELRKRLNTADYSILMSSLVKLCQDMLGWSDKMVFDVGNLKTKSLSQLNKSIDLNVNVLTNQMNRMSLEKGTSTKKTIVRTLREMKRILEAPLLQERIELNPGEEIEWKVDSVLNLDTDEDEDEVGRLVFTNYRCMYFGPNARSTEDRGTIPDLSIPLASIASISKLGDKKISSKTKRLEIVTKDLRTVRWGFKAGSHRRKEIFAWFKAYIGNMPDNLFCFQVHQALGNQVPTVSTASSSTTTETEAGVKVSKRGQNTADPSRPEFDGWTFYDPHTEFHRQGVSSDPKWTYTNANVDYELCDTYPTAIWVPSAFPGDSLAAAAAFRSRNRLPALAYYYAPNGATITRCSQPAVGVARKRCKEDELLLGEIGRANNNSNRLPIFDARPKANAVANTAMGYGYELIQHYPNCSLTFCDIENIHVMRSSLSKLRDAVQHISSSDTAKYLSEVDASGWISHQAFVINSSRRIVDLVHEQDTSVLIHCSDGWDRTAQLVSLSCLMLDPFYRTINGFATLVEKDWLSFGHRFALRHALDGTSSGDRAPIFHQFVEIVWQFLRQQPLIFEFNETFLITLLDEVYNAYYGTFIYDSQRERIVAELPSKTISVWTALLSSANRAKFTNPIFTPNPGVVLMQAHPQCLAVWEQYFLRYQPKFSLPPSLDQMLALVLAKSKIIPNGGDSPSPPPPMTVASPSVGRSLLASSSPSHSPSRVASVEPTPKKKTPYKRNRSTDPEQ